MIRLIFTGNQRSKLPFGIQETDYSCLGARKPRDRTEDGAVGEGQEFPRVGEGPQLRIPHTIPVHLSPFTISRNTLDRASSRVRQLAILIVYYGVSVNYCFRKQAHRNRLTRANASAVHLAGNVTRFESFPGIVREQA